MQSIEARLKAAAFNVQTQDELEDFAAIVDGLEGGASYPPLSADEQTELAELREKAYWDNEALTPEE